MRCILVGVKTKYNKKDIKYSLNELEGLVEAADGIVLGKIYQNKEIPDPATFIGKGKAQELREVAEGINADTIVFDTNLTPVQISNLKKITNVDILDRTDLILQIFYKRAKTKQAKLQVELAILEHQMPRIYGEKGKELSRIGGGMKTKGAGEQIGEIKARRIKDRINKIKKELKEIKKQKETQRKLREDNPDILKVSLVGYTNAGKSSLLKLLTKRETFISDQLFATLDTKTSYIYFPDIHKKVIITDTVGFVEDLPQEILDAFMTTLEEINEADIILHVIDISDENWEKKKEAVEEILAKLKVDKPVVLVFNKIDKVVPSQDLIEDSFELSEGKESIIISCEKKWNIDKLFEILKKYALKKGEEDGKLHFLQDS